MSSEEIERLEYAMNAGFGQLTGAFDKMSGQFEQLSRQFEQLGQRFEQLTRTMHAGFDTLADLQRETNERLGRLEVRFDHFIGTAGTEVRTLRRDVDDLKTRVERLESDRD